MTTTTMQLKVQRSRFLASVLPGLFGASNPKPTIAESRADRASREAAKVREMAYSYTDSQPGFAADLYAAAARHESIHAD